MVSKFYPRWFFFSLPLNFVVSLWLRVSMEEYVSKVVIFCMGSLMIRTIKLH